jgi:hypothetical protein
MLKAIHAQDNREAAHRQARAIVENLRAAKRGHSWRTRSRAMDPLSHYHKSPPSREEISCSSMETR